VPTQQGYSGCFFFYKKNKITFKPNQKKAKSKAARTTRTLKGSIYKEKKTRET